MRKILPVLLALAATSAPAATYYVRTDGNNSNPGTANTAGGAWLTIGKAASTMVAGDTVIVQAGNYPERVSSGAAGTVGNPITYSTGGTVTMRGFSVNHAYNVLDGFQVKHHSHSDRNEGHIDVKSAGDNAIIRNCTIGPGIFIKATDIAFNDLNPDTITSAAGGFIAAGFRVGATVTIKQSTSTFVPANKNKVVTVNGVTDTTLTLVGSDALTAGTGQTVYLAGSNNWGMSLRSGADSCVVENCTMADVGYTAVFLSGSNNLVRGCLITGADGWNGIYYSGTNNTVRNTLWKQSNTYRVYDPSPDAISNWSPTNTSNFLVEDCMVVDWIGALGFTHGSTSGSNVTFRRCVFADCGQFVPLWPGMTWDRCTFVRCSLSGNPLIQNQNHPITVTASTGTTTVKNCVFVACGQDATSARGWYTISGGTAANTNYNMVVGNTPGFGAKTGFSEINGINGGNPLFTNLANPLGADGLAFTEDDGLRPLTGSPLLGAGEGGVNIGAYNLLPPPPPPPTPPAPVVLPPPAVTVEAAKIGHNR